MLDSLSFTTKYIIALSIIAMLSVLAYYNLNNLISIQSNDSNIINISGRQRMLSQQIALYAIYYKNKSLEENIQLMEHSHKTLLAYPMDRKLKAIYFQEPVNLNEKVELYLFHAKQFQAIRDGRSLTYVLQHSQSLLEDLDIAVSQYVANAKENTKKLKQFELWIFVLTLVTLLFEALFIFRPANKKIIKDTKQIIKEKDYSNAVIESSTNAIITLDGEKNIRTFNKMAEMIFGYTKEQMIGKNLFDTLIPHKNLSTDQSEVIETEALTKDQTPCPIRISFGKSGEDDDILIVASIQDVSKEKLKDKIVMQQAKFAALGEMIAIIAHQWRQPLAQLNFNCMYIKKKLQDPSLIEEASKNEDIIQFMSETISNFENFYRHSDNALFHPTTSITRVIKIVESLLESNHITLIQNIDDTIKIYGNSNSLAQVVLSIVQNAIDAIKTQQLQSPKIQIALFSKGGMIVLHIEDNAGGIKTTPIDAIFLPFSSHKKDQSTGIGLYMSKLVIENQFHGTITVKNSKDGALFQIEIPSNIQNF